MNERNNINKTIIDIYLKIYKNQMMKLKHDLIKMSTIKTIEFKINMTCYNLDNKYTVEQITDMLIEWAESKDIYLGGSVKKL